MKTTFDMTALSQWLHYHVLLVQLLFACVECINFTLQSGHGSIVYSGLYQIKPLNLSLVPRGAYTSSASLDACLKDKTGCLQLKIASEKSSTIFVVPTVYSAVAATSTACLSTADSITLFDKYNITPCDVDCRTQPAFILAMMQKFAGIAEYNNVFTSNAFPSAYCTLLPSYTSVWTPIDTATSMIASLSFVEMDLQCSKNLNRVNVGCDVLTFQVYTQEFASPIPFALTSYVSITDPNLPPVLSGNIGLQDLPIGYEAALSPLSMQDPEADFVTLTVLTSGLARISDVYDPPPADPLLYSIPKFVPQFLVGAFNQSLPHIVLNVTQAQANRALAAMHFQSHQLGTEYLYVAINDQGRSGFPLIDPTLTSALNFLLVVKPLLVPPVVEIRNTDESWRFPWRPGVSYLKNGAASTIGDDFFPCGGDTVAGDVRFSNNGTGGTSSQIGWYGQLPAGDGSSAQLKRDCQRHPDTFWSPAGKAMYLTLDEGGKGRVFLQLNASSSPCNETNLWKVTIAIQNANYSRTNIPEANVTGYHMDWFECRAGRWFCDVRNPYMTLNNETGSVGRLTFHYDQQHRHLGTGVKDYRMTFTGTHQDVLDSINNITVVFPWLDETYDGSDRVPAVSFQCPSSICGSSAGSGYTQKSPWPFQSWPRTGRTLYGSNILRVRIEDVPALHDYIQETNVMWLPQGLYRLERVDTLAVAQQICDADLTCAGFQYLIPDVIAGVIEQRQIPSVGLGQYSGLPWAEPYEPFQPALGFSDRPPANWGLGNSNWDGLDVLKQIDWLSASPSTLPNAYFYRGDFPRVPIEPYRYNGLAYSKRVKTSRCLGPFPHTEVLLDVRVLTEPLNQPPLLTTQKQAWKIQKAYQFRLGGLSLYDSDAMWSGGLMEVTFSATRGAFTNLNANQLSYLNGTGTQDALFQRFLCSYRACQNAIQNIYYLSADTFGSDTITLRVNDRGNSGELGALTAAISISLTLVAGPYNVPPFIILPGSSTYSVFPGKRVYIKGIKVGDVDLNKPRWDKVQAQGYMTATLSIGKGFFDLTRVRSYGQRSLLLGTPDGSPDPDCPCPQQGSCPCNKCTLTNYCKISGLLPDVQWALEEVTVFFGLENVDISSVVQTLLTLTVNDNCNTGFSDDSGVQKPCLTASASITIEILPRPQKEVDYYTSPVIGVDQTMGYIQSWQSGQVVLAENASSVDNTYNGLQLTIVAGSAAGLSATISSYVGSTRTASIGMLSQVPDNTSMYSINCGTEQLPCK
mmetsp:Transcript_9747/g.32602  ORF Transcript_9747/g.32602 Transcript_9747/m.32602 type:complete len:1252 (-) Transcript_9747:997-4752(-)